MEGGFRFFLKMKDEVGFLLEWKFLSQGNEDAAGFCGAWENFHCDFKPDGGGGGRTSAADNAEIIPDEFNSNVYVYIYIH